MHHFNLFHFIQITVLYTINPLSIFIYIDTIRAVLTGTVVKSENIFLFLLF